MKLRSDSSVATCLTIELFLVYDSDNLHIIIILVDSTPIDVTMTDLIGFDNCSKKAPRPVWRSSWFLSTVIGFTFMLFIVIGGIQQNTKRNPSTSIQDCGSNPVQAKERGCVFDRINYGWTPPACLDVDFEDTTYKEAMKAGGPWKWYLDKNSTIEIPQDWNELSTQTHVWTEHRFHVLHCVYTWKLLHRAAMRDSVVYDFIGDYRHTSHCSDLLLDEATRTKPHARGSNVRMSFGGCVTLPDKK